MNEQQSQPTTTTLQETRMSACPHPEAVGKRWGDPISEERQAELQGYLDRWAAETYHGGRMGPFVGILLTGADVLWLAKRSSSEDYVTESNLHLEGAILRG